MYISKRIRWAEPAARMDDVKHFDICGTVHHHSINKNHQRDAAWSIRHYYACNITLHVSGVLCTHRQECIKTVHADSGTIVFRYGVRAGR